VVARELAVQQEVAGLLDDLANENQTKMIDRHRQVVGDAGQLSFFKRHHTVVWFLQPADDQPETQTDGPGDHADLMMIIGRFQWPFEQGLVRRPPEHGPAKTRTGEISCRAAAGQRRAETNDAADLIGRESRQHL